MGCLASIVEVQKGRFALRTDTSGLWVPKCNPRWLSRSSSRSGDRNSYQLASDKVPIFKEPYSMDPVELKGPKNQLQIITSFGLITHLGEHQCYS